MEKSLLKDLDVLEAQKPGVVKPPGLSGGLYFFPTAGLDLLAFAKRSSISPARTASIRC
jgi:hypothetical protein